MKRVTTQRGFAKIEFTDLYGVASKVQKSSLATQDAIWIGAEDIGLKVFIKGKGWRDVSTEKLRELLGVDEVMVNNTIHLSQEMVSDLIPVLQKFSDEGEI